MAHRNAAAMIVSTPQSGASPGRSPGSTRIARPTKPTATPTSVASGGRWRSPSLNSTTISGTAPTRSAARPEGTSCSATVTSPLPPKQRSVPSRAANSASSRVTRRAPGPRRRRRISPNNAPATAKRTPADRSGGMVSTITRIAR